MALKGKRTMIFAVIAGIFPALDALREILNIVLSTPEFGAIIPPKYYPYYALFVALGTAYLRRITTTPYGEREGEDE